MEGILLPCAEVYVGVKGRKGKEVTGIVQVGCDDRWTRVGAVGARLWRSSQQDFLPKGIWTMQSRGAVNPFKLFSLSVQKDGSF